MDSDSSMTFSKNIEQMRNSFIAAHVTPAHTKTKDSFKFAEEIRETGPVRVERKVSDLKKSRKYDPNLQLSFPVFCRLMGFNAQQLGTGEDNSALDFDHKIKRQRSNSLRLPSFVRDARGTTQPSVAKPKEAALGPHAAGKEEPAAQHGF